MPLSYLPNFEPTAWEQKLRAYRLENEAPKIRRWREEAEDPNTTGERLAWLTATVYEDAKLPKHWGSGITVRQALARHPNTPPPSLAELVFDCAGDFCQNPFAPFVMLEMPDFVGRIKAAALLREENAPIPLLEAMAFYPTRKDVNEIKPDLHVSLAGAVKTVADGEALILAFWQEQIADQIANPQKSGADKNTNLLMAVNAEMVEFGLAPAWANEPAFASEPSAPQLSAEADLWLGQAVVPGSPEENELWARIAPTLAAQPELADCVRADADEDALIRLVNLPSLTNYPWHVHEIIAAHPKATPLVFERLLRLTNKGVRIPLDVMRLIAIHPNVSVELLTKFIQFPDVALRHLARGHKNAPANARDLSRQAILDWWGKNIWDKHIWYGEHYRWLPFEMFVAGLHGRLTRDRLHTCGTSWVWYDRLTAALSLPIEPLEFPNEEDNMFEYPDEAIKAGCTTRDLLEHLARDGNRLVRWAAQTRLQNPDYVFRWAE